MIHPTRMKISPRRSKWPMVFIVAMVTLLTVAWTGDASAFSTVLKYSTEDQGKREILSFYLPPGAARPRMELMDLKTLRITVFGILALPSYVLDLERSRWMTSFKVDGIPGGELGIHVVIGLKKANLSFRDLLGETDPISGTPYSIEIDQLPPPSDAKATTILEGRALAGRDGTLVIISRTGSGPVNIAVELESRVVRIHWPNSSLAPSWRPVKGAGLAERLLAHDFSQEQVEMELMLHKDVVDVDHYEDVKAGLFIIELTSKSNIGRRDNARRIMDQRKSALASGVALPLNRLDPVFVPRYDVSIELRGEKITESYYVQGARDSDRDHKFSLARAYLEKLLQKFPDTPNRQLAEMYLWDLAEKMKWKPGWLLDDLNAMLATYPNMLRYPYYRLKQLHLLNRSTRYGEAASIMWDPNLPKGRSKVWLERGYTSIGLAHAGIKEEQNWEKADRYLQQALTIAKHKGDVSAEANYLLAKMAHERREDGGDKAVRFVDSLSDEQVARIANKPQWLMTIGDIYYENNLYPKAFKYYSQFISNYPTIEKIVPWAIVRAAESSRKMRRLRDARRLFANLQKYFPESEGAAWGRVFELRMDRTDDIQKRLIKLDKVIKSIALPDVLSEALKTKAELQGEAHLYQPALRTLNNLLSLSSRDRVVHSAHRLKREYLIAGMQRALDEGRPEHAILLAEMHGDDWRKNVDFIPARIALAEALLRIGLYEEGLKWLNNLKLDSASEPSIPGLTHLGKELLNKRWPEVRVVSPFAERSTMDGYGPASRANALANQVAMEESHPSISQGLPQVEHEAVPSIEQQQPDSLLGHIDQKPVVSSTPMLSVAEARVRLDTAIRLLDTSEWDGILNLLNQLPGELLNQKGRLKRLFLLARAEAGRQRYPQAVRHMETLFSEQEMGDGGDYYWYATLLQQWKGDERALAAFERTSLEASSPEIQSLAYMRLGDIMQRRGDFVAAVERYRKAAKLEPTRSWAKVAAEHASQLEMAMEVAQ